MVVPSGHPKESYGFYMLTLSLTTVRSPLTGLLLVFPPDLLYLIILLANHHSASSYLVLGALNPRCIDVGLQGT